MKQQRKALVFIEAKLERTDGIAHRCVRSPATSITAARPWRHLLQGLEERGFIRRLPGKDRAIEVLKPVSRFATFRFDWRTKALKRSGQKD
jgi:hypothetical protein